MLKIFVREAKAAAALSKYPLVVYNRRTNWPVQAASAIKLSGAANWAKSALWFAKNDLDLYQNTSQVVDVVDI